MEEKPVSEKKSVNKMTEGERRSEGVHILGRLVGLESQMSGRDLHFVNDLRDRSRRFGNELRVGQQDIIRLRELAKTLDRDW